MLQLSRDTTTTGFSQDHSKTGREDISVARAPNFSAQKRPRIHSCRATTTRNWLDSRRSFADVTTRKRKNKTVNGRRGARREEGVEQESERRKGEYIGRNIYEESSSMHPHPKVAPGCDPRVCVCVACMRAGVLRERVRARVCARVSACVKRDVATQAGMQFRNARVAHEASPTLLHHLLCHRRSLPLASSPRYRKKRGPREVTATRKELAGIPWEGLFLHFCT